MSPMAVSVAWTSLSSASSTWSLACSALAGPAVLSAPRAESSSRRDVLTFPRALSARPIEVDRVACQGVTKRSAMSLSCARRASPTLSSATAYVPSAAPSLSSVPSSSAPPWAARLSACGSVLGACSTFFSAGAATGRLAFFANVAHAACAWWPTSVRFSARSEG